MTALRADECAQPSAGAHASLSSALAERNTDADNAGMQPQDAATASSSRLHDSHDSETTAWYFAFGANMSEKKFCSSRGISPRASIAAMVPGYEYASDVIADSAASRRPLHERNCMRFRSKPANARGRTCSPDTGA